MAKRLASFGLFVVNGVVCVEILSFLQYVILIARLFKWETRYFRTAIRLFLEVTPYIKLSYHIQNKPWYSMRNNPPNRLSLILNVDVFFTPISAKFQFGQPAINHFNVEERLVPMHIPCTLQIRVNNIHIKYDIYRAIRW